MYSLRSIQIVGDPRINVEKELFEDSSFPNLKSLKLDWNFHISNGFSQLPRFFSNLEVFGVCFFSSPLELRGVNASIGIEKILLEDHEKLKNLKSLELRKLSFEKEVHLKLPRLRKLSVRDVKNLQITTGGELCFFYFRPIESPMRLRALISSECNNIWKKLISESPKLVHLDIRKDGNEDFDDCWFLEPNVVNIHGLPHLKRIDIGENFVFNLKTLETWDRLRNQLEVIRIQTRSFTKLKLNVLHQREYKSLRDLRVIINVFESDIFSRQLEWPCSQKLRILSIIDVANRLGELNSLDPLFQKNEFPHLEDLLLYGSYPSSTYSMNGKGWKRLNSLKTMNLNLMRHGNCPGTKFGDDFFREHDELVNLTDLTIRGASITGTGWNKVFFENLKVLGIHSCKNLEKSFFEENEFQSIEEMFLDHNQIWPKKT